MNWILKFFKMTCKDTSPLVSEMTDHNLPLLKRWKVKIHLAICKFCRYYKTQLETIRALARKLGREETKVPEDVALSPETRKKLKHLIENSH
ncbi:MAG: hypothetical protein V3U37_04405 [Nitrospinaceae bacterium]